MPTELAIRVIDAGATRFVDLRRIAADDLGNERAFAAIGATLAQHAAIDHVVFVMPATFVQVLAELTNVAQLALWPRFRAAAAGAMVITVFVDGARVHPRAHAAAQQAQVTIALAWPLIIGVDPRTGAPRTWSGAEIVGPA